MRLLFFKENLRPRESVSIPMKLVGGECFKSEAVLCFLCFACTSGKFFSRTSNASSKQLDRSDDPAVSSSDNANSEKIWDMVGCDNHSCPYEWFHLTFLKLTSLPKSKYWYCPDCRQLSDFRQKRSEKHSYYIMLSYYVCSYLIN